MKCTNCGAIVNPETLVCEYCGSRVEKKKLKKAKSKLGSTLGIAIAIIVVTAVVFVGLPIVCVFWLYDNHRDAMVYQEQEMLIDRLPQNGFDLVGVMGNCTTKGVTTIDYNDTAYHDVQILDSAFIEWLSKEGINPNGKGIMFSTDDNGNIKDVYIKDEGFVVMHRDGNRYVALRDDGKVITFETDKELNTDGWYIGYWSYSDEIFHSAIETSCYESYGQLSYLCQEKATPYEPCAISNKEVMVYKLLIGGRWYYCSKGTYDTVSVGDKVDDGYTYVLAKPYVYKNK